MHKDLLLEAFKKAAEDTGSNTISHLSQKLSDEIFEHEKQSYGERILRNKFNEIKSNPDTTIEIRSFAADGLSKYLNFEDFTSFRKSKKNENKNSLSFLWQRHKILIIVISLLILGFVIYNSINHQRWMVWQIDHYVEVDFDTEKYELNQLKLYKEERIKEFQKIKPTCDKTVFFKVDGKPSIWYGKNKNKELEFFTSHGLHPETGKTLKPISQYMIDKYVCD